MFDHVVGVSTGAILAVLLTVKRLPAKQCREIYMDISRDLFTQNKWHGTVGLVRNSSWYDTKKWINILQQILGDEDLSASSRHAVMPRLSIVSSIVNLPQLQPYIFRNYEPPAGRDSLYRGGTSHPLWQAVQASAAAPTYFEEVEIGSILHQDGGVIANNPCSIGVHEIRTLWPRESIGTVVSIGNGRSVQELEPTPLYRSTSARHKLLKIIDSATDTEAVHIAMHDLLSEKVYYRLNPYMSHPYALDEIRPDKLDQMINDATLYVRRNMAKIEATAAHLVRAPTVIQKTMRSANLYKDRNGFH